VDRRRLHQPGSPPRRRGPPAGLAGQRVGPGPRGELPLDGSLHAAGRRGRQCLHPGGDR